MKKIIAATLAATSALVPIEAQASSFQDHVTLAGVVESTGIVLKVNPVECGETKVKTFGWYSAVGREMVICQENGTPGGPMVNWTAEDLDTLRHEAQHLIQDCMDTKLDGRLDTVYRYPIILGLEVIGEEGVANVSRVYHEAPSHVIILEIEAFAVAAMNDPLEQVEDIKKFCF